jgi:hypothetical protein
VRSNLPNDLAHLCAANASAKGNVLVSLFIFKILNVRATFARGRDKVLCPGEPPSVLRQIQRGCYFLFTEAFRLRVLFTEPHLDWAASDTIVSASSALIKPCDTNASAACATEETYWP